MVAPTNRKLQNLKPAHEIVALLEARGCTFSEIADATGYAYNYIFRIRSEVPGYQQLVAEFKREIQERVIDQTADAITMFNSKVPAMVNNLETLALGAYKEGVRLRATMDWLDRAPDAPKRVAREEHTEERKIVFSIQQADNIRNAMLDVGREDVLNLLEGRDFEVNPESEVIDVDDD